MAAQWQLGLRPRDFTKTLTSHLHGQLTNCRWPSYEWHKLYASLDLLSYAHRGGASRHPSGGTYVCSCAYLTAHGILIQSTGSTVATQTPSTFVTNMLTWARDKQQRDMAISCIPHLQYLVADKQAQTCRPVQIRFQITGLLRVLDTWRSAR